MFHPLHVIDQVVYRTITIPLPQAPPGFVPPENQPPPQPVFAVHGFQLQDHHPFAHHPSQPVPTVPLTVTHPPPQPQ